MEFCIEKCAMLVMKSGKHLTDGMELPNQDKIKTLTENETIKQVEMKDQIQIQKNKKTTGDKTLSQKPYQRNRYLGCTPR